MLRAQKIDLVKGRMAERGVLIQDIAEMIDKKRGYVSSHLKNPMKFTLGEIYAICDALDIEYEKISEFFPREVK